MSAEWIPLSRTRVRAIARVIAGAAALSCAAGCARPGPPGGGPPDATPPEIVRTLPSDGELGVDRLATIEVEFSEEMNRESVERAFSVTPPVELRNLRWKGRTTIAEPKEALPESATLVVHIGPGARDHHDVSIAAARSFAFATGAILDSGVIAGVVTALDKPVSGATVWACPDSVQPDSLGTLRSCGYVATTSENGAFRFVHVRASDAPYAVAAFIDRDRNRCYTTTAETGWIARNVALIGAVGDSAVGLEIRLVAPAAGEPVEQSEEETP